VASKSKDSKTYNEQEGADVKNKVQNLTSVELK